jgi:quinol-cytochrome oxidoreductase complex cytochrome b subunit
MSFKRMIWSFAAVLAVVDFCFVGLIIKNPAMQKQLMLAFGAIQWCVIFPAMVILVMRMKRKKP